ncbi:MAG: TetR/AcrR family transcriptional regulator [Myxococcota bacterium]|nr:TetR/AcrR family transcriptional regulator [Myxococcota bacterium]
MEKPLTSKRHQARIEAFLDAAERIVVREGVDALTMAELARESEAAVGAVYRYLPGKGALMARLQVRALERLGELLDHRLEHCDPAPLARVEVAFTTWQAFAGSHPALHRLVDQSLSSPDRLLDESEQLLVGEALSPLLKRCAELLEQAEIAGALSPGDSLLRTYALWAAVHGAGHFRKRWSPQAPDPELLIQELIRGMLRGWSR